ncbi:type II secretory pathway protein [Kerstersia gyiorum]|nr:type II secretory pathway protein [Kerstersia gyiorum]
MRLLASILSLALAGIAHAKAVNLDLQGASISEVVQLIYREATTTPYVLAPDVLEDERLVSFRYKDNQGKLSLFMQYFLDSLGYMVERKSGVDFVRKRVEGEPPIQAEHIYIYQPQYRAVSYLSRTLSPLFKGTFVTNRSVRATPEASPKGDVPISSAASLIDQSSDVLVFAGAEEEIQRLRELLPQVDRRIGEVAVRGLVYEVSNTDRQGSAFGLLANLLGGHVGIGIGSTATNLGNFIQIKNTSLDAVYSMLSSDSRFKVVSSPALRIQSGSQGVFSVGQDVPVLGALSYPQGAGQAVQSVEYRSSGVIFDIRPVVKESIIDLDITQQLSNFVKTTTGVNNSPTLTKRELKTKVGMQDGDVIVLGGLTESKDTNTRDGLSFLPRFLHTTGYEQSSSEILLVLQVQRVPGDPS